jgi:hypothetical protein
MSLYLHEFLCENNNLFRNKALCKLKYDKTLFYKNVKNMIKLCSTKTSNEYLKDKRVFYNFELVTCLFEQVPPGPILTIEERENQLRIIISLK